MVCTLAIPLLFTILLLPLSDTSTDTTAMTLNATLGYLGLHDDFQQEVYEEIMSVMPTEADSVSVVDLTRLSRGV